MLDTNIEQFTEKLASKTSVPGGGGASALVGAVGIALGDMVGEFTVGKKKYADVEEDVKALMDEAQKLRVQLLECINKDAIAFEPLSKAYGIPKDDPTRDEVMEKCLKDAAQVPYEIMKLSARAIELQGEFAQKGSRIVISDAATGVAICKAALQGAAVNVKINTKSMKDREYAAKLNDSVNEMLDKYSAVADEIFNSVVINFEN
ncbi:MAG: cyclodeaminase/cyclohydrolase family protein [Lachnospiraceae bacterium]|nr:cyclodeaminase/cyclohydrolase family protein [Lachnospiraceae bacterium]